MIEIQHGCTNVPNTENTYRYDEVIVEAYQPDYQGNLSVKSVENSYIFVAPNGLEPEIGDFIVNGVLVKRTVPKVNNDWRMWKDKEL